MNACVFFVYNFFMGRQWNPSGASKIIFNEVSVEPAEE